MKEIEVGTKEIIFILKNIIVVIKDNCSYLDELDRKIGDGEHGSALNRGFSKVEEQIDKFKNKSINEAFNEIGNILLQTIGGASGALYGSTFLEIGSNFKEKKKIVLKDYIKIFQIAYNNIKTLGNVKAGDKTMLDTLEPVIKYLNSIKNIELDKKEVLNNITKKAKEGMESTKPMIAKKGRASFLKERSIGHLDPGAVSCFIIVSEINKTLDTFHKK
jgi:dihydroxyacetone kinase-like protein